MHRNNYLIIPVLVIINNAFANALNADECDNATPTHRAPVQACPQVGSHLLNCPSTVIYKGHNKKVNFTTASEFCKDNYGGSIITITSWKLQKSVNGRFKGQLGNVVWIGINAVTNNSRWSWDSGLGSNYTNWMTNIDEPHLNAVTINRKALGTEWFRRSSDETWPFICEMCPLTTTSKVMDTTLESVVLPTTDSTPVPTFSTINTWNATLADNSSRTTNSLNFTNQTTEPSQHRSRKQVDQKLIGKMKIAFDPPHMYKYIPFIVSLCLVLPLCFIDCCLENVDVRL